MQDCCPGFHCAGIELLMYVWWMIFGMTWGRFSRRSEPGAGISARWMASADPSSKSSEIKVLKALKRKAIMTRLITKNAMVPRLMMAVRRGSCYVGEVKEVL